MAPNNIEKYVQNKAAKLKYVLHHIKLKLHKLHFHSQTMSKILLILELKVNKI